MEIFFKSLRKFIILPIVLYIKWIMIILVSITLGIFKYIFENITSDDYEPFCESFYYIRDEFNEVINCCFDIKQK